MPVLTRLLRCRRLPRNTAGRDFVVGDLHGHGHLLEEQLRRLSFDPSCDRVLSVGDLVDRGPASLETLSLIREPWFHAVLGNHELMLLHFLRCYDSRRFARKSWAARQGSWVADALTRHSKRMERLRLALMALPLVLQVDHDRPYQVMHADIDPRQPPQPASAEDASVPVNEAEDMACSRANLASLNRGSSRLLPFDGRMVRLSACQLGPLPLTYVGHSPLPEITLHRSHVYIDQGVAAPGRRFAHPRLPTVLEHHAFSQWLHGLQPARHDQAQQTVDVDATPMQLIAA